MIIPRQNFTSPFPEILNNIHGVITKSERKLLILFERFAYKDGKIFPKQATIAKKMGISTRQVKNLIASLIKKGFIKVIAPSLVDRHLYGKGNSYHLLDHPAYHQEPGRISPEISPENADHTIYNNKDIKNKSRFDFDIVEFLKRNQHAHGQAIIDALNTLTARWPSIRFPGQYAQKIVDVQGGNYAEADHITQAKQKTAEINAGCAKIAETLGIDLSGYRNTPTEETPAQIAERMNRQRNEILAKFG